MNYKMMGRFIAQILSIEGLFMIPALLISLFRGESNAVSGFLWTLLLIIALAALLFGFLRALGNVYSGFDFLAALKVPSVVYNMLPYLLSLVVLAFTSKRSRAPKAEGIPYDKGSR